MPRLPRVDVQAADEGRRFDYPRVPGIWARIARFMNPRCQALVAKLSLPYLDQLRKKTLDELPEEVANEIRIRVTAETVLLEWGGIVDDRVKPKAWRKGRKVPDGHVVEGGQVWKLLDVTVENAVYLLTEPAYRDFQEWVSRTSQRDSAFLEEVAKMGKGSPSASGGGSGSRRMKSATSKGSARKGSRRGSSTSGRKSRATSSPGSPSGSSGDSTRSGRAARASSTGSPRAGSTPSSTEMGSTTRRSDGS